MNRALRLLPRLLLASTFAISAAALAEPPPPAPPVPDTSPRDAASGLPTGKRMHKPYTLAAPANDTAAAPSASCAATNVAPLNVASDPEEGGQIARTAAHKPKVGDMTVTRRTDTASTKLAESSVSDSACPPGQH